MERKLIKQGGGGLTVYLPKKWLDRKGLKEGDLINIIEKDASLFIGTPIKKRKEAEISLNEKNREDLQNILTHVYRKGFDKITLKEINSQDLKLIKSVVEDLLLGFEITEKHGNSCVVENISEPTDNKYEMMVRKLFLIIQETQETVLKDFVSGKFSNLKEMYDLKKQQDKFVLFCRRLIIKEIFEKEPLLNWEFLTFLLHIQHGYFYLYQYAEKNILKKNEEVIELLKKLQEYFGLYQKAYENRDLSYIYRINQLKEDYQFKKCLLLLEKSKEKDNVLFSYIREIFRLIQIGSSPILSQLIEEKLF